MLVKIIKDYSCFKKGDIYEVFEDDDTSSPMTYYIKHNRTDVGYKPRRWGFMSIDEIKTNPWLKIIEDNDEHNEHYKACKIEPWDIMEANMTTEQFQGFLLGNIVKYSNRLFRKGQASDDCDKIIVYAKKLKEVLNNSTRKELRKQD